MDSRKSECRTTKSEGNSEYPRKSECRTTKFDRKSEYRSPKSVSLMGESFCRWLRENLSVPGAQACQANDCRVFAVREAVRMCKRQGRAWHRVPLGNWRP